MSIEVAGKLEQLGKKHGAKMAGSWTVIPEHMMISVYDAPSLEAFQKFSMEPEIMKWIAYNTSEIKLAMTLKESMKLLK